MQTKRIRDLMVPLDEYAVVGQDATMLQAMQALDKAQGLVPPGREPHRAALVVNDRGEVIGKLGQWSVFRALEPKYSTLADTSTLARAGINDEFINSMMEHFRLFKADLFDLCRAANERKVTDVMRPVAEYVDIDASLADAAHLLVVRRTLSVLVREKGAVVGLLRLSDLFHEVTRHMTAPASSASAKDGE